MKKVFKIIFYPFVQFFRYLYLSYSWLLDNTLGLIFTKQYRKYFSIYEKTNKTWNLIKRIINIIILLVIIFSFQFIYKYTFGYVFTFIFEGIGKLLHLIIGGEKMNSFSKILTTYGASFSEGISTTIYLSLIGTTVGLIIAMLFSYIITLKVNRNDSSVLSWFKSFGKKAINFYITIVRGTPMMVQAMIIYWGTVQLFYWDDKLAGLVVVSLNTTAYLTEVLRGGIESVDSGQTEGALSLGLSQFQTMLYVVLPQALKNSMASVGNEFVINIKDTSVLSVIMVVDVFRVAESAGGATMDFFTPFIIAALIYLFLTLSVSKLLRYLETKLDLPETSLPSSN